MRVSTLPLLLAMAFGLPSVAAPALAADGTLKVELNKLEPHDGACRAYLVLENGTANAYSTLKLDLVMFDTDGVVARRLAVETAPLPSAKTRLKVFDMKGLECGGVGRVLLNAVMSCADASGEIADCQALVSTSSRGTVSFIK